MMETEGRRVVTIGGGTGQFALLSGLKNLEGIEITAIVSMADSGGSTGRLRDELGILPPGDVLKCILALSRYQNVVRNVFLKRFVGEPRLKGHNAGNLLLTMLSSYTGSFPSGIQALAEILEVKGSILPVTIDRATLVAELTDGKRVYGQASITAPQTSQRERIREIFLVPHYGESISVYPPVLDAIKCADYVIIGPGDLYTSIMPNLIVPGVKEALRETKAMVLYVVNIMTKFGETDGFAAFDFVQKIEGCIERRVDAVIANKEKPDRQLLARYRDEKAEFVETHLEDACWEKRAVYAGNLLDTAGGIIRHNSEELAHLIGEIL